MTATKKLGIWMDHSFAHVMELTATNFKIKTIESKFSRKIENTNFDKCEDLLSLNEQNQLNSYYKKIGEIIKNYGRVILFGPSDAKVELFDLLSEDVRFLKIKFEIKDTEKMTIQQQHTFIKDYFSEI